MREDLPLIGRPGRPAGRLGECDVVVRWIAADHLSNREVAALAVLLDADERAQAERFRFDADRITYVAAHALARAMLAQLVGRPPSAWRFAIGPFGKPAPIMASGEPPLSLNISHTRCLALVGASTGRPIGVDVERLDRPASMEVAEEVFHPLERALLATADAGARRERFVALWTLKEAYVKATGRGLDQPLPDIRVGLDPPRLIGGGMGADFRMRQWSVGATYLAALAVGWADRREPVIDTDAADVDAVTAFARR